MSSSWSNLANVVYRRTYSRPINENKFEVWSDTVERYIRGNIRNFKLDPKEIERLRYYGLNRKATPAGRGLWFSGTAAHDRLEGCGVCNCFHLTADNIENFVIGMDLLMLGGGVGFSVEHRYVSKLPKVRKGVHVTHELTRDASFIVGDSREGWTDLVRKFLESYFVTGKSFTYSTICVRGAGLPIKTFGGTSSGPLALIEFLNKASKLLQSREGKALRPIDASDLFCQIGEMVKSGNVRRSAILVAGDCWDKTFLRAKRWDLEVLPSERSVANYSVVADSIEDLHPEWFKSYQFGEPIGLINRKNMQKYGRMDEPKKDTAIGVNPCFSADTLIWTDRGSERIEDLVGQTRKVFDGKAWVEIDSFRVTGHLQDMLRVTLEPVFGISDIYYKDVDVTTYHKFYTTDNKEVLAKDLKVGDRLKSIYADDYLPKISKIESIGVAETVYCCTVPTTHQITLANGLIVGNCGEETLEDGEPCNLQNIALPNLNNEEEFIEAAILMNRYGQRVCLDKYHHEKTQEVVRRNMRVGTSITGCLQSPLFKPEILDRVYAAIQKSNKEYAKELGVPESIRTTTIQPGGTTSLVFDTTSGVHPAYSRYFIRRVRFDANDKLIPVLKECGHHIEPEQKLDGSLDHKTLVVDFYCYAGANTPVADENFDTERQLDTLLMAQRHWSDTSVSVTVYYKKNEIPQLKEWLEKNYHKLKTVSFLAHSDHGFAQSPYEAITEEQYNKLSSKIKPIEQEQIDVEGELESMECTGSSCPVR